LFVGLSHSIPVLDEWITLFRRKSDGRCAGVHAMIARMSKRNWLLLALCAVIVAVFAYSFWINTAW
jgi:hypothetical protein